MSVPQDTARWAERVRGYVEDGKHGVVDMRYGGDKALLNHATNARMFHENRTYRVLITPVQLTELYEDQGCRSIPTHLHGAEIVVMEPGTP